MFKDLSFKPKSTVLQVSLTIQRSSLEAFRGKLGKLYNSLETGKLDIDDLAPRIKELKTQINTLETKRNEIIEEIQIPKNLPFSANSLKSYVKDLAELLSKSPSLVHLSSGLL